MGKDRLRRLTDINLWPMLKRIEIEFEGLEKLKTMNGPVIFAVTHGSDWDITAFVNQLVSKTDIRFKIVASASHKCPNNPVAAAMQWAVGNENFIAIHEGEVNPKDFETMKERLDESESIVIAAYHNRDNVGFNQIGATLPRNAGVGAVKLAQISGCNIVPVAVNIEGPKWRARATIKIGDQIEVGENRRGLVEGAGELMRSLARMWPENKRGRWNLND